MKPVVPFQNPRVAGGGLSQLIRRHFCEEARGSFLDKSEVTDRVINVVKNFQKVDPSKVTLQFVWICRIMQCFAISPYLLGAMKKCRLGGIDKYVFW